MRKSYGKFKGAARLFLALALAVPQGLTVFAEETEGTEKTNEVSEEVQKNPEGTEVTEISPETTDVPEISPEESEEEIKETSDEEAVEEKEESGVPEEASAVISIEISPADAVLKIGEETVFTAAVSGSEESAEIVWSVSDPEVLSIDPDGKAAALKEGTATVRAELADGSAFAEVFVTVSAEHQQGLIQFAEESYEVIEDETITIEYKLAEGDYKEIVWKADKDGLIEINAEKEGEISVKGLKPGVTDVTAEIAGSITVFTVVVLAEMEVYESYDASNGKSTITGYYSVGYRQSDARQLAGMVNNYRLNTAHVQSMTYDYKLEEYAMQRAAEIVLSFSHTRPNGESWYKILDGTVYKGHDVSENVFAGTGGSIGSAGAAAAKILSDNTLLSNCIRAKNASFGIAHVVYDGDDYWIMIFCNNRVNTQQTSPADGNQDVKVRIRGDLYDDPNFKASKSPVKVNVNKSASLPSVTGTVRVKLGGSRTHINFDFNYKASLWTLDSVGRRYAEILKDGSTYKIYAGPLPNNDETAYLDYPAITFNGVKYYVSAELKVIQPVTGVMVIPSSAELYAGDTYKLTARVMPENASDKSVTWSTSSSSIASVNSQGLVSGKKGGKCKITVKTNDGGFKDVCEVVVKIKANAIDFEFNELTMTPELTDKLVPVFYPKDTTDQRVTFKSSDSSKVKVETVTDDAAKRSYGIVTALKVTAEAEPVVITMTSVDNPKLTAELPVTVKDKEQVLAPTASYLYDSYYEIPLYEYDEYEFENYLIKGDPITLTTKTSDARLYYTLDGSDPTASSQRYEGPFKYAGGNITLKVIAIGPNTMKNSQIAEFRIVEDSVPTWEIREEDLDEVMEKYGRIPDGLWAAGIPKAAVYNGNKITFVDFRVYYRNHILIYDQDYKVSYKDNEKADPVKPTVTITGNNNYNEKTLVHFAIEPLAISEENHFSYESELYLKLEKKAMKPVPVILWSDKKLKNNTDFVVAYSRNKEGTEILPNGITEAGDYYAIITGIKNFTADPENRLAVPIHVRSEGDLLSKASVKIKDVEYTGSVIDPATLDITVKSGSRVLVKDTDYVIEKTDPESPKEIGTVSLTIKAKDGSTFIGEKTATFKITGKSISKAKPYCLAGSVNYTGKPFTLQELFVKDPKRPDLNTVELYDGDTRLWQGVDYTVEIEGQNKGKGTVKFVGAGKYTGTLSKSFNIKEMAVPEYDLVIFALDSYFSKNGSKPDVYVFRKTDDESGYEIDEGVYGIYLEEGQDYTLKYTNNKAVYTDEEYKTKNPPTVAITLKGNYKGSATAHFLIFQNNISYMTMTASDLVYESSRKGSKNYVKPVITDEEGKTLSLNKDYTVTYYYAQDARVNGSAVPNRAYGTEIRDNDVPEAGTVIAVEATGIGSYSGTIKTEYKVINKKANFSSAKVKIDYRNGKNSYFEYTGAPIIPTAENFNVTMNGTVLKYGVDFEILSIQNNIKAGNASMVLRGIGNYGGTKKVSFKIGKHALIINIILQLFTFES